MHAIMFYHIYWEIKKLSFLNHIYDNYRDSEYLSCNNLRQALFIVSVLTAKPVFVVSVLTAKPVFVVSVGLST